MKRTARGRDDIRRYDRWGFDDPAPRAAPQARDAAMSWPKRAEPVTQPAREDRAPSQAHTPMPPQAHNPVPPQQAHDPVPQQAHSPVPPQAHSPVPPRAPSESVQPTPPPRPSNPAASPWRKIQIPDEERQRAAIAGIYRYVAKAPPDETGMRRAPLPVAARFAAPRAETPPAAPQRTRPAAPVPPPAPKRTAVPPEPAYDDAAEEAALARAAAVRARHAARQPETPRATAPQAQNNPHLGLTVGVIVAVSLIAAVGLSWVAAPTMEAAPPQRADLLQSVSPQSVSPQTVEPSAGLARTTTPDSFIEVAPSMRAQPPAKASAVQPIEVAP